MRVAPLLPAMVLAVLVSCLPGPPAAAAAPASAAAKVGGAPAGLPWIEDDLTRALAEARARDLPLFVESWAPW